MSGGSQPSNLPIMGGQGPMNTGALLPLATQASQGAAPYANSGLLRFTGAPSFQMPSYTPAQFQAPQLAPYRGPLMGSGSGGQPAPSADIGSPGGGVGEGGGYGSGEGGYSDSQGGQAGYISEGFNTGINQNVANAAGLVTGAPLGLINLGINTLGSWSAGLHGGEDGIGVSGPGGIGVGAPGGLSAAGVGAAGYGPGEVGVSATGPNSIGGGYGGGYGANAAGAGGSVGSGSAGEAAGAAAGAAAAAEAANTSGYGGSYGDPGTSGDGSGGSGGGK